MPKITEKKRKTGRTKTAAANQHHIAEGGEGENINGGEGTHSSAIAHSTPMMGRPNLTHALLGVVVLLSLVLMTKGQWGSFMTTAAPSTTTGRRQHTKTKGTVAGDSATTYDGNGKALLLPPPTKKPTATRSDGGLKGSGTSSSSSADGPPATADENAPSTASNGFLPTSPLLPTEADYHWLSRRRNSIGGSGKGAVKTKKKKSNGGDGKRVNRKKDRNRNSDSDIEEEQEEKNADHFWPEADVALRTQLLEEAKARCRPLYLGAEKLRKASSAGGANEGEGLDSRSSSSVSSSYRYPPAAGTRVFGFGAEGGGHLKAAGNNAGSESSSRAHSGRWVRFWIASVDTLGNLLCNGGSDDTVNYKNVATELSNALYVASSASSGSFVAPPEGVSPPLSLPPLEDLYDIALEAVPHDTLASMVVSSQMPDGMGFDEYDDVNTKGSSGAAAEGGEGKERIASLLKAFDATRPTTFREVLPTRNGGGSPSSSNYFAGFRTYYGDERAIVNQSSNIAAAQTENAVGDISSTTTPATATSPIRRGVTSPYAVRSTKIAVTRSLYIGYGLTEVHAYVRHPGVYDLCATIVQTGASSGVQKEVSKDEEEGHPIAVPLRVSDPAAFPSSAYRSDALDGTIINKQYTDDSARLHKALSERAVQLESVFALHSNAGGTSPSSSLLPPPGAASSASPLPSILADDHREVQFKSNIFRCVTGTFTKPSSSSASATQQRREGGGTQSADSTTKDGDGGNENSAHSQLRKKPLCTAPLSAFPSVEVYKNRFRRGHWVQLKDGVCDGEEFCVVAAYDGGFHHHEGADERLPLHDGLPVGFSPAPSQSFWGLLRTEGWLWASDTCVMVFFHQDGIAERLLDGTLTSAWGSSVLKQPMSNFMEYRVGRPVFERPFPVFMEELPMHAKRKKMPGFFSYREWAQYVVNSTRRLDLSTGANNLDSAVRDLSYERVLRGCPSAGAGRAAPPITSVYEQFFGPHAPSTSSSSSSIAAVGTHNGDDADGSGDELATFSRSPNAYRWCAQMTWAGCPNIMDAPDRCRQNGQIGMGGTFGKLKRHVDFRLEQLKRLYLGTSSSSAVEGSVDEALSQALYAFAKSQKHNSGGRRPNKRTSESQLFDGLPESVQRQLTDVNVHLFPHVPTHLLLEFSIWRWPMEDDVYLNQIAAMLLQVEKMYEEVRTVVEGIYERYGGQISPIPPAALSAAASSEGGHSGNSRAENRADGRRGRQRRAVPSADGKSLLPPMPLSLRYPLIIFHHKPATLLVDNDKRDASSMHRGPMPNHRTDLHTGFTLNDVLGGPAAAGASESDEADAVKRSGNGNESFSSSSVSAVESRRPRWESKVLAAPEARSVLRHMAHDNPFFIVIPRLDMSLPFHIGNRYGHFGLHYGSSRGMCATGGARPGYELQRCLRKPWVDTMVAELWLNAIVSHTQSLSEI